MSRNSIIALLTAVASASALPAQEADPFSTEIKRMYEHVKNNVTRIAEKMPEANYSFRPTPEIRTFAQVVGHVADIQARSSSAVNGEPHSLSVFHRRQRKRIWLRR